MIINLPLITYYYYNYGWDKCRTLIGWLPVRKKSSCPLRKFILPAQEIHLARSWKHCTNKIFKETKAYCAVLWRRRTFPEWVLLSWRNKLPKSIRFKVKTTPNKTTVRTMLQTMFLQHFNGFILHGTFVVYQEIYIYFRILIFFLWSIVIVLLLQQQKPAVYTAESCSNESVFCFFLQIRTNCDPTKPYNKSLINLVCSVCTGKYCLRFLSHRPRSFVARSVWKTSGNTSPYRPRTRLISP